MTDDAAAPERIESAAATTTSSAAAEGKTIGSIDIQIREVDVSRPARSVNRMWPNR